MEEFNAIKSLRMTANFNKGIYIPIYKKIQLRFADINWTLRGPELVRKAELKVHDELLKAAMELEENEELPLKLFYVRVVNDALLTLPEIISPSSKYLLQVRLGSDGKIKIVREEVSKII